VIVRPPPRLVISIDYESAEPRARVVADTMEDEARLWAWLRHSGSLPQAAALALGLFEQLLDDREGTS
jgi:hypothetical protein